MLDVLSAKTTPLSAVMHRGKSPAFSAARKQNDRKIRARVEKILLAGPAYRAKISGMDRFNVLRIAFKGLAAHKVRAFLSMLGIIFGVASVVAVITVSEGARTQMLKQLAALGANNIIVDGLDGRRDKSGERGRKKHTRLYSAGLTLREALEARKLTPGVEDVAALRRLGVNVRRNATTWEAEAWGATASFLDVMGFPLREGRWFNPADEAAARRVCVLESNIADRYFGTHSPIGKTVVVAQDAYEIIGVLRSKEKSAEKYDVAKVELLNKRLYIPLSTALTHTTQNPLADEIGQAVFRCRSTNDIRPAAKFLEDFYTAAHHCEGRPPEDRDFKVLIARDLLKQIMSTQNIFNIVMLCSAGISLLVGGIGIMNIMLANVGERRWEIGIRRAVGATQSDILLQFLFESLAICLIGGLVGCLLGLGFKGAVAYFAGWETRWVWWAAWAAVGVAFFDGVLFGTYPAWKAAGLDPIDALRYE